MDKQQTLIDLLKAKNFSQNNITGFLLMLETDEEMTQMIDWLQANPDADQNAIFDILDEIANLDEYDEDDEYCDCEECDDEDCDCGCGGEHHHDHDGEDDNYDYATDHCNYVYVASKPKQ